MLIWCQCLRHFLDAHLSEAMHIYHLIALMMVLGGIFWQIEVSISMY